MDGFLQDSHGLTLLAWGITITAVFVIMLIGMYRSITILHAMNQKTEARVRKLFLCNMIERTGVSLKDYFRRTSDLDKEKHIWACEHCPNPDECISMFSGADISPEKFCPNHHCLVELRNKIKPPYLSGTDHD